MMRAAACRPWCNSSALQVKPRLKLTTLLDQQLWFIGHDIRHAGGNALTRFGFERWRTPGVGTSCYRLASGAPTHDVVCWGFGIYIGPLRIDALRSLDSEAACAEPLSAPGTEQRGVFIPRHATTPRLIDRPLTLPLHQPSELPVLRAPVSANDWLDVHTRMAELAEVLARYESWAREALGTDHRSGVLALVPRHKRRRFSRATDLAELWCLHSAQRSFNDWSAVSR